MAYTSFGTRKALGRRYSQDPALILEAERLQREYGLAPAREARALQASQFDRSLAQQNAQYEQGQANAKSAGMAGTVVNTATNAAMLRGMTMGKGEPFFGQTVTGYYDKMMGNAPAQYQPVYQGNATAQGAAGGIAGGTVAQYAGAPAPAMDTLSGAGMQFGNYGRGMTPTVNPATMPEASSGVGMGGPAGMGASTAGVYGAQGGIGTGIGETMSGLAGAPILAPAAAGMAGSSLMKGTHADEWMAEHAGFGGKKDWDVMGGAAAGAAVGGMIGGPIGAVAGGVIGAVSSFVSDIFGW